MTHKRTHQLAKTVKAKRAAKRNEEKVWKEKGRRKQIRAKLAPITRNMMDIFWRLDLGEYADLRCLHAFVGAAESDPMFRCE